MVRRDLERIGIPYETDDGIADFHAAGRHTHITELLRNGASLPEAKELARHSDIKTTMKYTHFGINDQARAVAALPLPKTSPKNPSPELGENVDALHGRYISGGADGHSVAAADAEGMADKRQNPCGCKGFGNGRHRMSSGGKIGATGRLLNFFWLGSGVGQLACGGYSVVKSGPESPVTTQLRSRGAA